MSSLDALRIQYKAGKLTKSRYIQETFARHKELFAYAELLQDTDVSKIEITGAGVVMTIRGGVKFMIPLLDERSMPLEALNFGSYERSELEFIKKLINPRGTILDIGANIGWYSLHLAKAFPNTSVYAFEPIPDTYFYLKKNITLNGFINIKPYNIGLSEKAGKTTLYYYPEGSGNASAVNLSGNKNVQKVAAKMETIDRFCKEKHVRADFIKCDVEGAELLVVRGGLQTITRDKPVIFVELLRKWSKQFGYEPDDVLRLLEPIGYRCFTIRRGRLQQVASISGAIEETNFFFTI